MTTATRVIPRVMDSATSKQRKHFRCPLCGSDTFAAVEIVLRNGTRFEADFYHCTDCSLHFVHPERFMHADGAPVRAQRPPAPGFPRLSKVPAS